MDHLSPYGTFARPKKGTTNAFEAFARTLSEPVMLSDQRARYRELGREIIWSALMDLVMVQMGPTRTDSARARMWIYEGKGGPITLEKACELVGISPSLVKQLAKLMEEIVAETGTLPASFYRSHVLTELDELRKK